MGAGFELHIDGCSRSLHCEWMSPYWGKPKIPDSLRQNGHEQQAVPFDVIESSENVGTTVEGSTNTKNRVLKCFKFALVNFLKNLLKPYYWKRQEISYEVHKEILRKATSKIIKSLGESNIPRSHQDIKSFLSSSESKMSKLIQEYVRFYKKKH